MHPNCPVCGFADMPYPPVPYKVCPCCATEFGVDDRKTTHQSLRQAWVKAGMPWFSDIRFPAKDWSAARQLIDAGFGADLVTPIGAMTTNKTEQKTGDRRTPRLNKNPGR